MLHMLSCYRRCANDFNNTCLILSIYLSKDAVMISYRTIDESVATFTYFVARLVNMDQYVRVHKRPLCRCSKFLETLGVRGHLPLHLPKIVLELLQVQPESVVGLKVDVRTI